MASRRVDSADAEPPASPARRGGPRDDSAPWLHGEVARRMAARLPLIRQAPQRWIDWWGQRGGGGDAVRAVWPKAERWTAEPTPRLAEASRRRLRPPWWRALAGGSPQQRVVLESDLPAERAQMVWANMVLHHSASPAATLARWHSALEVGGFLMFSTLGPDTLRELRQIYAAQHWPSPHRPFTDMHDIGDLLLHSGFADPVMDQECITLSWSSPQALLDELRALGRRPDPAGCGGLRTARWRERLWRVLAERANAQGRIELAFELVYGHAYKAPPRAPRDRLAAVSVDALRLTLRNRRPDPIGD